MTPAKEVGGDFYDFFFVDDDHLALVIADVSGKGVPAALFMMMSKNLIHNLTAMGLSPKDVIERANRTISMLDRNTPGYDEVLDRDYRKLCAWAEITSFQGK